MVGIDERKALHKSRMLSFRMLTAKKILFNTQIYIQSHGKNTSETTLCRIYSLSRTNWFSVPHGLSRERKHNKRKERAVACQKCGVCKIYFYLYLFQSRNVNTTSKQRKLWACHVKCIYFSKWSFMRVIHRYESIVSLTHIIRIYINAHLCSFFISPTHLTLSWAHCFLALASPHHFSTVVAFLFFFFFSFYIYSLQVGVFISNEHMSTLTVTEMIWTKLAFLLYRKHVQMLYGFGIDYQQCC